MIQTHICQAPKPVCPYGALQSELKLPWRCSLGEPMVDQMYDSGGPFHAIHQD